ncbi:DNA-formamidopyrimidine glycosylase [Mycoplasma phocimorsus]|uniref:DNA-formamidopyrimidine glycosylase n=1 Tax=Mycoplasma phocimorsus TaxID=3045839 RepID=UPI0024C06D4A|nr:DNA-formamidopyrimidine glycosylase [Mycoplasma phocimorsus]MDJ1647040.1 DNA-formamidopyrimidine glycosylase [Mycoplasma phocimorsus]MDJ1647481.1 DNA-formamidopyrimidine glycosylase [Mycoplasma phocimorsus]MDJ1647980.1 DNA-formamidopyrimidine glycosylase [Mycoplasma phocimorsus]MDJ1648749.1 DNA-formamidopyrimidine glycosylase [Mycoplasma phocimorsus]
MPELPEVRVVAKSLKNAILNKTIIDIDIINTKFIKEIDSFTFKKAIINQKIIDITNRGKFLLFFLSNNNIILSHLRMEGKYATIKKGNFPKHTYLVFKLDNDESLCYSDSRMFGTFHLRNIDNYNKILPLSKLAKIPAETNLNELHFKLLKKNIAIKTALLDQSLVVGLGNIYVNEALWASKINPNRKAKNISKEELKNILDNSTRIMDESTILGGSTISSYQSLNFQEGSYQNFLKVHNKEGEKCLRCDNLIIKIKVNGRGTYYCSYCQK